MCRPQHSKVAVVERRELWLVEPFNDGEDGCIDEPDVGIGVLFAEGVDPAVLGG